MISQNSMFSMEWKKMSLVQSNLCSCLLNVKWVQSDGHEEDGNVPLTTYQCLMHPALPVLRVTYYKALGTHKALVLFPRSSGSREEYLCKIT